MKKLLIGLLVMAFSALALAQSVVMLPKTFVYMDGKYIGDANTKITACESSCMFTILQQKGKPDSTVTHTFDKAVFTPTAGKLDIYYSEGLTIELLGAKLAMDKDGNPSSAWEKSGSTFTCSADCDYLAK